MADNQETLNEKNLEQILQPIDTSKSIEDLLQAGCYGDNLLAPAMSAYNILKEQGLPQQYLHFFTEIDKDTLTKLQEKLDASSNPDILTETQKKLIYVVYLKKYSKIESDRHTIPDKKNFLSPILGKITAVFFGKKMTEPDQQRKWSSTPQFKTQGQEPKPKTSIASLFKSFFGLTSKKPDSKSVNKI